MTVDDSGGRWRACCVFSSILHRVGVSTHRWLKIHLTWSLLIGSNDFGERPSWGHFPMVNNRVPAVQCWPPDQLTVHPYEEVDMTGITSHAFHHNAMEFSGLIQEIEVVKLSLAMIIQSGREPLIIRWLLFPLGHPELLVRIPSICHWMQPLCSRLILIRPAASG